MDKRKHSNKKQLFTAAAAVIMIILLILWLTLAEATGNTDVFAN